MNRHCFIQSTGMLMTQESLTVHHMMISLCCHIVCCYLWVVTLSDLTFRFQTCISITLSWMQSSKLKLNTERTEMMLVGSLVCVSLVGCKSADIGGSSTLFQHTTAYHGVHPDQTLSLKQHISSLCHTWYLHSGELCLSVCYFHRCSQ